LQNNLSDYEFLSAHAKRTGNILAVVDGKLCFDKPDNLFAAGPKLTMGENLRQFSVRLSSALQAKEVKAVGWDFTTKKPIESAIPKPVLWHINGQNQPSGADFTSSAGMGTIGGYTLTSFAPRTQGEADALAKSASGDQEGKFAEADGVAYGHPKLVAGVKVDIDNVGDKYKGTYYVTSATHIYNTSGYEVHFTVSGRFPQTFNQLLNGTSSGPGEPGMISGVVIGIVTNNKDDKGLGRVKVRFPWLPSYKKSEGNPSTDDKPGIESNWARIAAPGAGVARGMYYLPEVEDEVLVAFEHGNPNLPYIIGGLWNPIDLPPEKNDEAVSQKVNHRMIVSRSGHKIVLDDEEGKESILIMDKTTKQSIFIDSTKNSITIKGDGDLLIDMKGNITIKSGMTIEIEATSDIKMKGINLSAEATGTYKVSATTELEMKSNGFANFESTTAAALKGPTLDIEASAGPASIQGKPIMLN